MRMFLRKPAMPRDPLPVTMAGVRMGERILQVGFYDPQLTAVLAAKPGLSGNVAIAVNDTDHAERARRACADAGVLADVLAGPLDAIALEGGSIDVAIVHGSDPAIATMDDGLRERAFRECGRVLRTGGRLIVVITVPHGGVTSLFRRQATVELSSDRVLGSLQVAGFRATRLLAEREGHRFFEGLKG
jgi:hypothetical protein